MSAPRADAILLGVAIAYGMVGPSMGRVVMMGRTEMEKPHVRSFDHADTSRALAGGRVDLIQLGGLAFDRATFEPGWRWSEVAGSASCQDRHLGYLISGCMRFRIDDGSEIEARAGDVYLIPPGHDAWVVGDEPCIALDLNPL